jgi:hypothetical protein
MFGRWRSGGTHCESSVGLGRFTLREDRIRFSEAALRVPSLFSVYVKDLPTANTHKIHGSNSDARTSSGTHTFRLFLFMCLGEELSPKAPFGDYCSVESEGGHEKDGCRDRT